jgi:hypothetical protein
MTQTNNISKNIIIQKIFYFSKFTWQQIIIIYKIIVVKYGVWTINFERITKWTLNNIFYCLFLQKWGEITFHQIIR